MIKHTKNKTNKIIILLIVVTLCSFTMPNYAYAAGINGGSFFTPIAEFIAWVADLAIEAFQSIGIGDNNIKIGESDYYIRYSPGIIFSGTIPMFDINFIKPQEDYVVKKLTYHHEKKLEEEFSLNDLGLGMASRRGGRK